MSALRMAPSVSELAAVVELHGTFRIPSNGERRDGSELQSPQLPRSAMRGAAMMAGGYIQNLQDAFRQIRGRDGIT